MAVKVTTVGEKLSDNDLDVIEEYQLMAVNIENLLKEEGFEDFEIIASKVKGLLRITVKGSAGKDFVEATSEFTRLDSGRNPTLELLNVKLSDKLQGRGISQLLNRPGVVSLESLGGKKVFVNAGDKLGAYAWLRRGFFPDDANDLRGIVRSSSLSAPLKAEFTSMTDSQLKNFVLTDDFRENYKNSFRNKSWIGSGDISSSKTKGLMLGEHVTASGSRMATMNANQEMFDAYIRHQTYILRMTKGLSSDVNALLDKNGEEVAKIIKAFETNREGLVSPADWRRAKKLQAEIAALRGKSWKDVDKLLNDESLILVKSEPLFSANIQRTVSPIVLDIKLPPVGVLESIVKSRPFEGRILKDHVARLAAGDVARMQSQIQLGMSNGESMQAISRRIFGTITAGGADGTVQITRNDVGALTRTAVQHVANEARREHNLGNQDIFSKELYSATLDGVTCWSKGTMILMEDGTEKAIENIEIGDEVVGGVSGLSCKVTGKTSVAVESSVAVYNSDLECIGNTTDGHKILTGSGWREVSDIRLSPELQREQKVVCRGVFRREEPYSECNIGDCEIVRGSIFIRETDNTPIELQSSKRIQFDGRGGKSCRSSPPNSEEMERVYPSELTFKDVAGKIEIISLTIEGDESYVAGGIVVHNTPICKSLDGQKFDVGFGPHPPIHWNCRSIRVPFFDELELNLRPSKAITKKMLIRKYARENDLGIVPDRASLPIGHKGKFDSFSRKEIRRIAGPVDARQTYQSWLGDQSKEFRVDTLGVTKEKLFTNGDLPLKRFVAADGSELTLSELAGKDSQAFVAAGLDPKDFLN